MDFSCRSVLTTVNRTMLESPVSAINMLPLFYNKLL